MRGYGLLLTITLVVVIVAAFAGVQPMAAYKDKITNMLVLFFQEPGNGNSPTIAPHETSPSKAPTGLTSKPELTGIDASDIEQKTFRLINLERERVGALPTKWDNDLYKLSKAHTEDMAVQGQLFHTPVGASYGENCWGGSGYYSYFGQDLPMTIVDSWMSSPLHKDWLLHKSLRTSVVSIVLKQDGQWASWTFWTREAGEGPPLVNKIANDWRRETGESIPWLQWLKMKGYLK